MFLVLTAESQAETVQCVSPVTSTLLVRFVSERHPHRNVVSNSFVGKKLTNVQRSGMVEHFPSGLII